MLKENNLKIYNTLTNSIESFKPIQDGEVTMYVCGPTVYNYIHIGNARPLVFFDVVYRYLKKIGYNVKYISNFTDIDDKIIAKAIEEGVTELEITNKFIAAYNEDVKNLNCLEVDIRCKVTDYMPEIVKYIDELIDKGFAYKSGSDVYFRVNKLNEYGVLSNNSIDELNIGERISVNDQKEHPADFTLWKETDKGITFDSSNGSGRPGWHTECVVMIKSLTSGMVDIHGGGNDLCFPHHENEIAQSVATDNNNLANYWMHNGMLNLNNTKMSKSLGNIFLARDFIEQYGGNVLRLVLLQTQYRNNINLNDELIDSTVKLDEKFLAIYKKLSLNMQLANNSDLEKASGNYVEIMDEDFNTPNLVTYLLDLIKKINVEIRNGNDGLNYYNEFIDVLYILGLKYEYVVLSDEDKLSYNKWIEYRNNKDFENADKLRIDLESKGVI